LSGRAAAAPFATSARRRALLLFLLAAFFAVQLAHTVADRNTWPFCSYNVFSFLPPLRLPVPRAVLHQDDGAEQVVPLGRVVPLEFFRARQVLLNVLMRGDDPLQGERVAAALLRRLNEAPWPAFDETLASARPAPGRRFVGLDLVLYTVDTADYRPPGPPRIVGARPAYAFREVP
jgi:hypothetical protein